MKAYKCDLCGNYFDEAPNLPKIEVHVRLSPVRSDCAIFCSECQKRLETDFKSAKGFQEFCNRMSEEGGEETKKLMKEFFNK